MTIATTVRNTFHIISLVGGIVVGLLIMYFSVALYPVSHHLIGMLVLLPLTLSGFGILVNSVASIVEYLTGRTFRLFTRKPRID